MNWDKLIKNFLKILENPESSKGYSDLIKSYKNEKLNKEAEDLLYLLENKFKNDNNSNIDKK